MEDGIEFQIILATVPNEWEPKDVVDYYLTGMLNVLSSELRWHN